MSEPYFAVTHQTVENVLKAHTDFEEIMQFVEECEHVSLMIFHVHPDAVRAMLVVGKDMSSVPVGHSYRIQENGKMIAMVV